ncbi:hypothetical protein PS685_00525 [Pseudomonas fluorescens]|uniref:Uncharacterized protein n=1 Tax=Pseudomonas fluorescens TaxID=294 RepID=A0A5E6YD85_PSEFL|nr:hypothetical protein PS685_00525 [Pseudomonas fluorescens]
MRALSFVDTIYTELAKIVNQSFIFESITIAVFSGAANYNLVIENCK